MFNFCLANCLPDEVWFLVLKWLNYMNYINFSTTCKKFYSLTRSDKKFKQLLCFSKRILNFDDSYVDFLHSQFQWLTEEIWTKLNEKFKEDTVVFSFIKQKLNNLPNLLLLYRIYCLYIEFIVTIFDVWGEIFWFVVAMSVKKLSLTILTIP